MEDLQDGSALKNRFNSAGHYISSDYDLKKPEKRFMEILLKNEGLNRDESVMVGNEVKSDAAVAAACGMDSIVLNTAHEDFKVIKVQIRELHKETGISGSAAGLRMRKRGKNCWSAESALPAESMAS